MYSRPSNTTFAALTIASAASTAPTNPFVSIIPSASIAIRRVLRLRRLIRIVSARLGENSLAHEEIQTNKTPAASQAKSKIGCLLGVYNAASGWTGRWIDRPAFYCFLDELARGPNSAMAKPASVNRPRIVAHNHLGIKPEAPTNNQITIQSAT